LYFSQFVEASWTFHKNTLPQMPPKVTTGCRNDSSACKLPKAPQAAFIETSAACARERIFELRPGRRC
jgi:hypothetical protein